MILGLIYDRIFGIDQKILSYLIYEFFRVLVRRRRGSGSARPRGEHYALPLRSLSAVINIFASFLSFFRYA